MSRRHDLSNLGAPLLGNTRSRALTPSLGGEHAARSRNGFRAQGFWHDAGLGNTLFGPRYLRNDGLRNQRRRRTLAYRDAERRVHALSARTRNICSILPKRCSDRNRYRASGFCRLRSAALAAVFRTGSVSDADLVSWRLLSSCLPASQWFRSPTPTPAFICSATRLRCCWWRSVSQSASTACGAPFALIGFVV